MFKNGFKIFSALLLTILLTGTIITKPVHILFAHHSHEVGKTLSVPFPTITTESHHDCPICDFEFCSYIAQKPATLPQAQAFILDKLVPAATIGVHGSAFYHFLLRAPPVV